MTRMQRAAYRRWSHQPLGAPRLALLKDVGESSFLRSPARTIGRYFAGVRDLSWSTKSRLRNRDASAHRCVRSLDLTKRTAAHRSAGIGHIETDVASRLRAHSVDARPPLPREPGREG